MTAKIIDTHAHFYDRGDDDVAAIVDDAVTAGVDIIINTAVSLDTAGIVIRQCRRFPERLRAVIGISPFDTANVGDGWENELRSLLTEPLVSTAAPSSPPSSLPSSPSPLATMPPIIALGEIGLDRTNPTYPPLEIQTPIFIKQLSIAAEMNLPTVIHSRGMEKHVAEICKNAGVAKAVFHCFTGDREAMEYVIDCGYYISISGIITYKNSHLRDIVKYIPRDKLVIETDAPYLAPVPHRGKINVPAYLVHTAAELAKILEVDIESLSLTLRNNTIKALNLHDGLHDGLSDS